MADVVRTDGFIDRERRSFGDNASAVASAACRFAAGLSAVGVAYTLKHFPGLGDAAKSTDSGPVTVTEPLSEIREDDAAYRNCGHNPLALVMVSSASYTGLTGHTPAVLDSRIYSQEMQRDRITALPISDSFETGAIQAVAATHPARRAIDAGADMVMYASYESDALGAYSDLLSDAREGSLNSHRVLAASYRVLQLKGRLGLIVRAAR